MLDLGRFKFTSKVTLLVIFSLVLFSILFSSYTISVFDSYINESFLNNLQLSTFDVSNLIDFQHGQIESATKKLADVVSLDFNYDLAIQDKNYLNKHMDSYFEYEKNLLEYLYVSNVGAVAIYMVYDVEDFNGVYETWFVVDDKGEVQLQQNEPLETFDSSDPDMSWYYDPKNEGRAMWTDVYSDSQTKVKMISYVMPIYSSGKFIGIAGIDVSIEGEQNYIDSIRSINNSTIFIVSKNGGYITKPKSEIDSRLFADYIELSKTKDSGHVFGENDTLFFKRLGTGNVVVSSTPNSFRQTQVFSAIKSIILISLGLIILISILSNLITRRMTKGLKNLQNVSKEISKGNFKVRAEVNTSDEIGELAESFNKSISSLEQIDNERKQIDKVKTEFLSITSHELRSPMTPMRAQLQMLLGGYFGKLNSKQKEAADIILRNTERLDKILLDFLEISRIEAARLKFTFVKTSLEPHIRRVYEEMKSFLPEKHVTLELKCSSLPEFEVDPDRVMQVLRNLINNAVKFVPDEGGKVTIAVQPKGDYILFSVKDNGVGIADENKRRLFEPFFQEEQTMYRKYAGTGLGLAICKGIIGSQHGKIWFDSVKGKGTTFYFTVPFIPVKEIAPIKVLFSERAIIETQLKKIMLEFLGPLGDNEFESLKRKEVTEKSMLEYIDILINKGVISDHGDEFKSRIKTIFSTDSVKKS